MLYKYILYLTECNIYFDRRPFSNIFKLEKCQTIYFKIGLIIIASNFFISLKGNSSLSRNYFFCNGFMIFYVQNDQQRK